MDNKIRTQSISYWKVFRLIFVLFSLYLLRDAFFRWDGFRYHSTFFEFIPSVALVTVMWSIVAACAALVIWLLLRGFEWFCQRMGWKIKAEVLLMFIVFFVLLIVIFWIGKKLIIKEQLSLVMKLAVLIVTSLTAIFLTWRFRNKYDYVHERFTPLVLLFAIWSIVSIPIVVYHSWLKQTNNLVSHKTFQSIPKDTNLPNIILVIFDALTAQDMSAYGYNRPTTPFISEWSNTASLFNRVESSSNWTTSATTSLLTGRNVWSHRMFHEYSIPFKSDIESLPFVLKNFGYYNMAFVVNPFASPKKLGMIKNFDIAPPFIEHVKSQHLIGWKFGYLDAILTKLFEGKIKFFTWIIAPDFILGKMIRAIYFPLYEISQTEVPPEMAFEKFLKAVDTGVQEPFFAWIHLYPPHDPYLPREPYIGMFDSSMKLRTYNEQMEEVLGKKVKNIENWGIYRARYDEFIRDCDKTFENFILQFSKKDKSKNTIIILTSDHGDSFEHNYFTHGNEHLYEQVTHIPLIIKEPDQTKRVIINDLVEQIDITPTILGLANIPAPSWMEGRSLLPLLRDKKLISKPVFSMNFEKNPGRGHQITKGTIAVWEDDYKLIHYLDGGKSLLFNLKEDPGETINLFNEKHDIGQRLLALIKDNLRKANERIGKGE
ncbi:MAG: sulfatase-like hydrolase/transferase [Nitrospirae bacterium]|nr:sulfatase-like hydrolase/transferase [Nitrospirota bacterium]